MQKYKVIAFASLLALGSAAMATQANAESNISGGENLGPPLSDFYPQYPQYRVPGTRAHASVIIHHRRTVIHHPMKKAPVTDKTSG